jgi:hypothetical protein
VRSRTAAVALAKPVEAELRPLVDTERTHPAGSNERVEDKSHGEYQPEHHSNDLRCAPFTHCGRYYPARPVIRK